MADDVQITAGSGTVVATDEVSSRHYQLVKPAYGADGSATLVAADAGLPTQAGWKEFTGTAAANNTDLFSQDVSGYRWVAIQLTGTFSATVNWQGSNDGTNWVSMWLMDSVNTTSAPGFQGTTTNRIWVGPVHTRYFRARTTAYTSGTVGVTAGFSAEPSWAFSLATVAISGGTTISASSSPADAQSFASASLLTAGAGMAYNGTNFDRLRTPTTFKSATATASGNTALWTPTSSKKFRLMRFKVDVSQDAAQSSGGVITVELRDGTTTPIGVTQSVFVPGTAATTMGGGWSSGWVDLGNGFLSAAANNVLNINLSAALTSGTTRVVACGTEE